jgi:hypothetical protein
MTRRQTLEALRGVRVHEGVLDEQIAYYRARAPEFDDSVEGTASRILAGASVGMTFVRRKPAEVTRSRNSTSVRS